MEGASLDMRDDTRGAGDDSRDAAAGVDASLSIPFTIARFDWLEGAFSPFTRQSSKESYIRGLVRELEGFAEEGERALATRSLSIGPGGIGTLEADLIADVFGAAARLLRLDEADRAAWIDPGVLSTSQLDVLRACGVNRYVVRFLSSDPRECDFMGLPGAHIEMQKTAMVLDYAGSHTLDMQLVVGLYGQSERSLRESLVAAMHYHARHIQLVSVRPSFGKACDDATTSRLFSFACGWLEEHGFLRYAPCCFARPGAERPAEAHRFESLSELGFGMAATSVFNGLIWENVVDIDEYIRAEGSPEALTAHVATLNDGALQARARWADLYHLRGLEGRENRSELLESGLFTMDGEGTLQLSPLGSLRPFEAFALI